jgi:uncharacterized OB-fold protein
MGKKHNREMKQLRINQREQPVNEGECSMYIQCGSCYMLYNPNQYSCCPHCGSSEIVGIR